MNAYKIFALLLAATTPSFASPALAADAPAAAPAYSVESTNIGTLLETPAAKAIIDKHLPGFTANPQLEMGRGMTLKQVQPYASEITDEKLVAIAADLAKLPAASK